MREREPAKPDSEILICFKQKDNPQKESQGNGSSSVTALWCPRFAEERETEGRITGQVHTTKENSGARPETLPCTLRFLLPETLLYCLAVSLNSGSPASRKDFCIWRHTKVPFINLLPTKYRDWS